MSNIRTSYAEDILIVDDEADIRSLVGGLLSDEGYETREAADSDATLAAISARRPGLVLLDIWLQGSRLDGMELLEVLKRDHPHLSVVIMSGHGNIETAVQAIKLGAYDFIEKPFKADRMILIVNRAIEAAFRDALPHVAMAAYDAPVALFRPPLDQHWKVSGGRWVSKAKEYVYEDNDWGRWMPKLSVHEVPGDHDSMVLEPNVRVMAARLRALIAEGEA